MYLFIIQFLHVLERLSLNFFRTVLVSVFSIPIKCKQLQKCIMSVAVTVVILSRICRCFLELGGGGSFLNWEIEMYEVGNIMDFLRFAIRRIKL